MHFCLYDIGLRPQDHGWLQGWINMEIRQAAGILYIAGIPMYLSREVDWESRPRKATIVFSGLSNYNSKSNLFTYWGKKVN